MLPEFLKTATRHSAFVAGGDQIHVAPDLDQARIAACKSKKAKGVYELMKTFRVGEKVELYSQGLVMLQQELGMSAWQRGQGLLSKKKGNSMLRGNQEDEDEEDARRNPIARFIKRANPNEVVADFAKATSVLTSVGLKSAGGAGAGGAEGAADNNEPVKTLKEVLEEREEQMRDIE